MSEKGCSLRQKIGQTMMFGFHGTEPSPEITSLIRDHHVGGIILFARNIGEPKDVLRLTIALQKIAYEAGHRHPLLISIDQENGIVRRLGAGTTLLPGNMALGATGESRYVQAVAEATGRELKALGINYNLAPVLDINNNPHNPVIGVRSYGEDPQFVAECGSAAIHGLQAAGVAACGKHFPGHGDTSKDSHLTLPLIPHDLERLKQVELVPFVKAIADGVDSLMIAHVCFPEIEPDPTLPATLSRRVVTDLLRNELGYQGVITTDCMEMKAIADSPGTVEGTYRAFQAGIDLSFISHTYEWQIGAIERLVAGIEAGDTPVERLDDAVGRILKLKEKYLHWDEITPWFEQTDPVPDAIVGGPEHEQLAREVMEAAVTLTKNEAGLLPMTLQAEQTVAVVCLQNKLTSLVEDERYLINPLQQALQATHRSARCFEVQNPPTEADIEQVIQGLDGCAAVIVGTMNAQLAPGQSQLVQRLNQSGVPLIVISMRTPYDLAMFPEVATHIAAYEWTPTALQIAVEAIFGQRELCGRLPVTIPNVAVRGHRADNRGDLQ
ncbi:beta-N-acetylhexosaminidase [Tumebacillus algifaecis]|uniref:Beta-N-acetylhexosaminidase n=1 Tax=Tumebacillus algifaecis TaxID=1214604 RepID=A0A223D1I6_9BACL|nr:beta-N-acetylhexosaminidase [Tumebacillus algifaecis]ASS75325.1 beta-N-acetylhexosaminidase [Tumebacillus algifaecis]